MANKVPSAERIREIMYERGLRQVDVIKLSEKYCIQYDIKFTKSTLSQYLSGEYEPGQDKLFILGLVFDVNEAWLMGFDVPKERGPYLSFPESDPPSLLNTLETRLSNMLQSSADRYVELFLKILEQGSTVVNGDTIIANDESQLLEDYRSLTPPGQEYIRQTMAMAVRTYSAGDGALPQLEDAE